MIIVRHCLLFAVLILSVYTDVAHGKVYNWCTLPAILAGLLLNYVLGGVWDASWVGMNLGSSALAVGMVAAVFAWPYLKGGIAAGDVKLMLAVAAIGGFHNVFIAYALFYAGLIGALMAVLAFIWRGKLREGLAGALRFTFTTKRLETPPEGTESPPSRITVPYGVAIALGSVIAWYQVELLVAVPRGLMGGL